MRSRVLVVLSVLSVALPLLSLSGSAQAGTSVLRFKTLGFMSAGFGDCPDTVEFPPVGTMCHEGIVQVFREATSEDGKGVSGKNVPWGAVYFDHDLSFLPDEEVLETNPRFGYQPFIPDSGVTYDQQHLAFASVATGVDLDDGSAVELDLVWHALSDREVYGNNGPSLGPDEFNLVHHYVDRCSTVNNQAHQKHRYAAMTGTVDGQAVHSYLNPPTAHISYNHFVFITATHGPTCA